MLSVEPSHRWHHFVHHDDLKPTTINSDKSNELANFLNSINCAINYFNCALIAVLMHISFVLLGGDKEPEMCGCIHNVFTRPWMDADATRFQVTCSCRRGWLNTDTSF